MSAMAHPDIRVDHRIWVSTDTPQYVATAKNWPPLQALSANPDAMAERRVAIVRVVSHVHPVGGQASPLVSRRGGRRRNTFPKPGVSGVFGPLRFGIEGRRLCRQCNVVVPDC
ncbi:hypothetical protein [Mycobacterium sp. NAZ190054]|uniref:hypothetical protein n=1 Tax=Mycobacterium sp. NAZ190054 TaxID=1747766 RepID=UPI0012E3CDAA|nr:hypothetical protein [Mycobacterium sp. NAZ190054]